MTITLDLSPEAAERLAAQARERGLSVDDYVREIVTKEAQLAAPSSETQQNNLSDLLLNSPFFGADLDLRRQQDFPRQIGLE